MKPSEALRANRAAIRRVISSHCANNARVFGSIIRGFDSEHSDLDLLIDPTPETTLTYAESDRKKGRGGTFRSGGTQAVATARA
jgi:predicted nucleotidyltransferase